MELAVLLVAQSLLLLQFATWQEVLKKTLSKFRKKIIPPKTNSQNSAKLNKENNSTQDKLS
jgi:hypothetical protein